MTFNQLYNFPASSKKIAFFLPTLAMGGAEKVMTTLAIEFSKQGFQVDFVLTRKLGVLLESLPSNIKVVDLNSKNKYLSFGKLVKYFRVGNPDVFFSSLHPTNVLALIAKRMSGANSKVIIRIATSISGYRRIFFVKWFEKILLSWVYPWADEIVTVSKSVSLDMCEYLNIPPSKVRTIYNPTITAEMQKSSHEIPTHPWFQSDQPPVLLSAGRLTKDKGYRYLLEAFAIVRKNMEARLVLLGDGDQRSNLEVLSRKLGVEEDVDIIGFVKNPYMYMRKANVFVLSSLWEGLPNVLIEALACDCSVVSTDCPGGVREILDNGVYGELVPVEDSLAMAIKLLSVLDGKGKIVDSTWLEKFQVEKVVEKYTKLFFGI